MVYRRFFQFLLVLALLLNTTLSSALKGQLGDPVDGAKHKHNFAYDPSSSHPFKAENSGQGEATEICIYCHTPHGANVVDGGKLWNRKDPLQTSFPLYGVDLYGASSSGLAFDPTVQAAANYYNTSGLYPNGASRLCMSCHDGISAIGDIINDTYDGGDGGGIPMQSGAESISAYRGAGYNTIIDLSVSHPISFVYNSSVAAAISAYRFSTTLETMIAPSDPTITPLDGEDRMQCTTCHDPHDDTRLRASDNGYLPMWRYADGDPATHYTPVCSNCHNDDTSPSLLGGDAYDIY